MIGLRVLSNGQWVAAITGIHPLSVECTVFPMEALTFASVVAAREFLERHGMAELAEPKDLGWRRC